MNDVSRTLAFCAGALLDQGRVVDRLSRRLTAAALVVILAWPLLGAQGSMPFFGVLVLVAAAGVSEAYLAMRVAFDAALFHRAASAPEGAEFVEIDAALTRL